MNILRIFALLALLGFGSLASAAEGLVVVKSPHSAKDTMNRQIGRASCRERVFKDV